MRTRGSGGSRNSGSGSGGGAGLGVLVRGVRGGGGGGGGSSIAGTEGGGGVVLPGRASSIPSSIAGLISIGMGGRDGGVNRMAKMDAWSAREIARKGASLWGHRVVSG